MKQWIRTAADELAVAEGCVFDEAAAAYVCDFLETFCRQSKGEWEGQPLGLLDWQRDFLARLYGWKRPDGTRRFRKAYLEVPKKNGKSTIVSGLALFHLVADGEGAPEIYVNAYDRKQASIIYDEAERMVRASPALKKRLEWISSKKRIVDARNNGVIEAQSADVPSKDGLNASLVVFDELHRQATPAMWRIFRYAGASRRQPLTLSITTAGSDRQSVCFGEHEYTESVNNGTIADTRHLGVIYAASETDNLDDRATWRKANPSLGVTIREDDFAAEYAEAKSKPSEFNEFCRLRFNLWLQAESRLFDRAKWDACGANRFDESELAGESCYAGLDLASTVDLAAAAFVFRKGDKIRAVLRYWLPEERAREREKKDRVPYLTWAKQGLIKLTPGDVIDYAVIHADIAAFARAHEIKKLLADPWNATQLCLQLRDAEGIELEFLPQTIKELSGPTKELERLVIAGELEHNANAVLTWNADNAVAIKDPNGNLRLAKNKSREKIDGLSALVNAIAAMLAGGESESVYESRGLLIL